MNYRSSAWRMDLVAWSEPLYRYMSYTWLGLCQVCTCCPCKSRIWWFLRIQQTKVKLKCTFVAPNTLSLKSIVRFMTLVWFILYADCFFPPNISLRISSNPPKPAWPPWPMPPWNPLNWLKISYWLKPPAPPKGDYYVEPVWSYICLFCGSDNNS